MTISRPVTPKTEDMSHLHRIRMTVANFRVPLMAISRPVTTKTENMSHLHRIQMTVANLRVPLSHVSLLFTF